MKRKPFDFDEFQHMNYTRKINLDRGECANFALISYANEFATELEYTEKERLQIINSMIDAVNFTQVLNIFKKSFNIDVEINEVIKK